MIALRLCSTSSSIKLRQIIIYCYRKDHILALLQTTFSRRVDPTILHTLRRASDIWNEGNTEPAMILAATRAHWGIENNLHWQLDITFDEDHCRTRKDFSPLNFALIRHAVLNMLTRDETKISLKRRRIKAAVNPAFRTELLAC